MPYRDASRRPTLAELSLTFAPFALGTSAAILLAIAAPSVVHARAQYTIYVSLALAAPAIAIFFACAGREPLPNLWRLWWTFAYLAYLAHFYFAYVVMFSGSAVAVNAAQGRVVAILNFVTTVVWGIDVLAAWLTQRSGGLLLLFRWAVNALVFASFVVATAVFRDGLIAALGWGLVLIGAGGLLARWLDTTSRNRVPRAAGERKVVEG